MTRQALEDAYIAGFKDGRDSVGKVSDDDASTHCLLGFDGWWSASLDTLNRAPSVSDPDGWIAWDGSLDYPTDVSASTIVDVQMRSGLIDRGCRAGIWMWRFRQANVNANIVAYRVIK